MLNDKIDQIKQQGPEGGKIYVGTDNETNNLN